MEYFSFAAWSCCSSQLEILFDGEWRICRFAMENNRKPRYAIFVRARAAWVKHTQSTRILFHPIISVRLFYHQIKKEKMAAWSSCQNCSYIRDSSIAYLPRYLPGTWI